MQRFEPIAAISPRRAQAYGEPLRRKAAMARAGVPVPPGFLLGRGSADDAYARLLEPNERPSALLDPALGLPTDAELAKVEARVAAAELEPALLEDLMRVDAELRGLGAPALVCTAVLVCDKPGLERVLGGPRLAIEDEATLVSSVRDAFARAFDGALLRKLRAEGARDASVALCVERMVDGMVSGVLYTRHPLSGDAREWLLRAGFGLASAVRDARVATDVVRLTRDGFVRDQVVGHKTQLEVATAGGERELRDVPAPLVDEACLSPSALLDVRRVAERAERHLGHPMRLEWSMAQGRVYVLRTERLSGKAKVPKAHRGARRELDLWSHTELGEAIPNPLTPLAWSLLRRFARSGLEHALFASGARLSSSSELVNDVRGRAYLNFGLLTETVCRVPGLTPEALARVGLEGQRVLADIERAGPIELARSALRMYDAHVRFGRRVGAVSSRIAGERMHFAGLDARLLSPDAVERVLCDVERWLFDVGTALMRSYGVWLATLVAFRALLVHYAGGDAERLERDLLWGPEELTGISTAADFVALAHTLARDTRATQWAEGDGTTPAFVRESVQLFAARHRHEGMLVLDPASPRWREVPERLEGALRALIGDPMALAFTIDRREIAKGRRERADREWKRRVPMTLWPVAVLLISRIRELTRHRESLLSDTAQAIAVIRDTAKDASRRLEMRHRGIGADAAFFLDLEELHAALAHGHWDVTARVAVRRMELAISASLPVPESRFSGLPSVAIVRPDERISGIAGSGGAAEGTVVRVRDGSELARLPRASVLVVPACDVGLSAVLPAVRAVVSECGGMLSHGAMLASALGVPVIVGVERALDRLTDGERVRVDADACTVERLVRPAAALRVGNAP